MLNGVAGETGGVTRMKFIHEPRAVVFHCLQGEAQARRDFFGAEASGHELDDFNFPGREGLFGRFIGRFPKGGRGGRNVNLSAGQRPQSFEKRGKRVVFPDEGVGMLEQHLANAHGISGIGKNEDFYGVAPRLQPAENFTAGNTRDVSFEHEDPTGQPLAKADGLFPGGRLADDIITFRRDDPG